MGNKLKQIFSNDKLELGLKMKFENGTAYETFINAIEKVKKFGNSVELDGVKSIETTIKDGVFEYPYLEEKNVTNFHIYPYKEPIAFPVETEFGNDEITFSKMEIENETVLETTSLKSVTAKFFFSKKDTTCQIRYKVDPIKERNKFKLAKEYAIFLAFIKLINGEKGNVNPASFEEIENYFSACINHFKKMNIIEEIYSIEFDLSDESDFQRSYLNLEEVYALVYENKTIRSYNKFTSANVSNLDEHNILENIGKTFVMKFIREKEYLICDQSVRVYTANLISNIVLKDYEKLENGDFKLIYEESENKPMIHSFTGFVNETDLNDEFEVMLNPEHIEKYMSAETIEEYIGKNNKV